MLDATASSVARSTATRCLWPFLLLAFDLLALGGSTSAQQASPPAAAAGGRLQVLFLGAPTQNGPHHDPITRYAALKKGLGVDGIDLSYSEDPAALSASTLAAFDALLLYGNWDQRGVMPEEQLDALLAFVDGGGGFVAVHCASACWGRSPAFVRLVGGRFARHGGEEFAVEAVAPDHPILSGLTAYRAWDETYEHDEWAADRVVLQRREQEPWTWVRTQGNGRVFYTAGGHDHRVWDLPAFQQLLRNGILWAVGPEKRELLAKLSLPQLEEEAVSLPGYREKREITRAQKPLGPEDSMKLAQVATGLQLSLFASEPQIVNPIHIAWDHRGRAFVVETVDYPNNLAQRDLGHDRITICEDTDGDGRADRFTRFAEGLSIPTSLTFANGGVICTNGPDMLFLADTDGDDRADVRKVLFTGFRMSDTHASVSNLRWERDGWIWATIGYSGFRGAVGGERHDFAQGLLRFRPDGQKLEFLQHTTNNTWGLGFTQDGDVLGSTANGNPSWFHTFPDAAYRAVGLEPRSTPRADDDPRFFPMSRDIRQADFFDRFTAAAGHAVYTAARFPREYRDRIAFVCEPTGKLVAMFELERKGGGFTARQSPNNLFASADAWTSPVCAEVGPDGAVWICDWYNLIIQHNPTPTRSSAGIDAKTGRGSAYETPLRDTRYGRIYRVFPRGTAADAFPVLDEKEPQSLLAGLSHRNLTWRLHAQRLLVECSDASVAKALVDLVRTDGTAGPHALHALKSLGALSDEVVAAALRSSHAGTARAAIALANVSVLKQCFVTETGIRANGRALGEVLVRLAESAVDPEIGTAILRSGVAGQAAIFGDPVLADAWQIAARRHADTVLAAAQREGLERVAPAEPQNLLPNADFTEAADGVPAGWNDLRVYSGAGAGAVSVAQAADGRNGTPSLRVSTERASDCGVAVAVKVQRGTRYRLSGWIRTENVTPIRGSDGAMLNVHGGKRTAGVQGTTDWTRVAVEFDASSSQIVVHCLFGGYGGARGTAWFDDVSLVPIGSHDTLAGALASVAEFRGSRDDPAPAPIARTFAPDPAVHERGASVYSRTCIACHGLDGKGLMPSFPPLDGSDWLNGTPARAIHIVLHGLQGEIMVGDTKFVGAMPPLGWTLQDAEIADVLTYVRQRWSNDAAPITVEQVAACRAAAGKRLAMWTVEELRK
ncbi:MAG TPA: PVC-type heme-binding CxxCH protein [Planctomycetota bacterium]|nr:PVC-type heme-binding CxxCH protein [Planctomycetota bacterium]